MTNHWYVVEALVSDHRRRLEDDGRNWRLARQARRMRKAALAPPAHIDAH